MKKVLSLKNEILLKTSVWFSLFICFFWSTGYSQPVGARITNPIVMGTYSTGTFSYTSTKNNSTSFGYLHDYGQPSDDIYYKFTVSGTARVDISHCSSGFDTYMHLLNSAGGLVAYNDDNGPLCSGNKASIQTTLSAGTYFIVSEGWGSNSGSITTSVALIVDPPIGARINNPIIIGNYTSGTFSYSDTRNNSPANGYLNDYGQASDDIYYQFTLLGNADVDISHCSSPIDTYVSLLNGAGTSIGVNDDYGPICSTSNRASLQASLEAGTYYIVSEGFDTNSGNITTALSLNVQSDFVYNGWNTNHKIGTASGNYNSATIVWPEQLVEIYPAGIPNTGLTYQWEQSLYPASGFASISGATQSGYSLSNPGQTMYYRRKTMNGTKFIYSNVIKIAMVSPFWEDLNYVREHNILKKGVVAKEVVDVMPIGEKLQGTTYFDGLGRPIQNVSRETATPSDPAGLWGDVVQLYKYDLFGREPDKYLPYSTLNQTGKYKTTAFTEQPDYYLNRYNETSAYSRISFDNSPLNRVSNVKQPGTAWAAAQGNSAAYDVNVSTDNVRILKVDYIQGNPPVIADNYPDKTLFKNISTDENGKKVIEYINKNGQLILKKVQLQDNPSLFDYTGWICTYYVYDDFGQLRFQLQPEAVNYLVTNGWTFAGANGLQVLNEWCFQYDYDTKGRNIWKKPPGALPLRMIYDNRDRLVFTQDGNQAALPVPQWTATIYDELDRPVLTTLYNTTKTVAQLQADINAAAANTNISMTFAANTGGSSVTLKTSFNPVSQTSLNAAATCTVLSYKFYDDYNYPGVKSFNTGYTNTSAYSAGTPNVETIAKTQRTTSMATGSRTRVLGGDKFLFATQYYDERGMPQQLLEDNVQTGTDITTLQYHFDGRVLSTCTDHTTSGTGYTNYKILTKNNFDKIGRINSLEKQFGTNAIKTISTYSYDDMGRMQTKVLDPGYTGGGNTQLESLIYSYNLHNQLTGINKDYALKRGWAFTGKWSHYFGMYLGYDNRDNIFTQANLTGQVTGVVWNTQGDDVQRRYDYTYDNAGRLVNAAFTEKAKPSVTWTNAQMDFSVTGFSGKITYDLNGNLQSMLHKGVVPGTSAPVTVDDLRYQYASYTNKLQSVTDLMTLTASNGKHGDFKDGTNNGSPDYVYDNNGNVIVDLNKNAQSLNNGAAGTKGIQYNYLDKPELIRITGKGHIRIVYDAAGRKLQRAFIPDGGGPATVTTYINGYVYQKTESITTTSATPFATTGSALSFINFEEGRIRVVTPTNQNNGLDALIVDGNIDLPNSKRGVYDYFIMDYQQNVRMILTEEVHTAFNTATMETTRSALEESIFGQTGAANEVAATRYDKPAGWTGNTTAKVSRLGTNAGKNTGPNTLQRVMAGDKVSATVKYYHQGSAGGNNTNFLSTVLGSLAQAISGGGAAATVVKDNVTNVTSSLGGNTGFINAVQPNGSNPGSTVPQAFLTILFFDERFNMIPAADGGVHQQQVAASVSESGATLTIANIKAPKNGYAYAYISNQSNNDVYFDDLNVAITTGNIIEENHYYSYGLKIAAISSRKLSNSYEGVTKNNYLYQGSFAELDDDIGWTDFPLRNYDAQIGRWMQPDPYQEFPSPYTGMGNDPVNLIDPSGGNVLTGLSNLGVKSVMTLGGALIGGFIDVVTGGEGWNGLAIGGAVGLGASFNISATSIVIQSANAFAGVLNISLLTSAITQQTINSNGQINQLIAKSRDNLLLNNPKDGQSGTGAIVKHREMNYFSEDELKESMVSLLKSTSGSNKLMQKVVMKMYDQFINGRGGEFSDRDLTNAVKNDINFIGFVKNVFSRFNEELKRAKGDISKVYFEVGNPAFNRSANYLDGLGITIHGVSNVEVRLKKFIFNSETGSYYAELQFDLYDNFGLDDEDIDGGLNPFSYKNHEGLKAWYLLQHKFGHIPLRTKITVNQAANLNINNTYRKLK